MVNGLCPICIHLQSSQNLSSDNVTPSPIAGLFPLDTRSESDMEAAIDPLLCHYQGPVGSLLCRKNIYSPDPPEVLTGLLLLSTKWKMWPWMKAVPGVQLKYFHYILCIQAVAHLYFFDLQAAPWIKSRSALTPTLGV